MTIDRIGQTIRDRRKQLRLSQSRLAELASCSTPSVIAAEHGKPTIRLDKLLAILSVLGLSLAVQPSEQEA